MKLNRRLKSGFVGFLVISLTASTPAATLKEVKDEYFKKRNEAVQKKDPTVWWALAESIKSQQATGGHTKDVTSELNRELRDTHQEAILSEMPRLSPENRDGFIALGKKADELLRAQGSAQASRKVYDTFLRAHPLDEEFYQIFLKSEHPTERFFPNEAKSEGWLALIAKNPKAEDFASAAQWHRALNEKEYWRAPFRVAFCYAKAIKLAPQSPEYRVALQEHLMQFLTPNLGKPNLPEREADGKYRRIDYRPGPVYVAVTPDESAKAKSGTKLVFKVETGGAVQYPETAPDNKQAATRVWKLLFANKSSFSGGFLYNDSRYMWAPLQWDPESNAWVLYSKEQERQNITKNIEFFRTNLNQYQKSVKDWETKSAGAQNSGNIVDQYLSALGESFDTAKVEKVLRDFKFRSSELAGLGNWVGFYRTEIPRLEEFIKALEKELN